MIVSVGTIRVNGVDIRDSSQDEVRSKIGFVPQKAFLFQERLRKIFALENKIATQDEIEHAARIAQAEDFISKMKDGYMQKLNKAARMFQEDKNNGFRLHGHLLRKPDIYIFDDSFSALDFKTDANLRAALKDETKNATVLIVAQRVSTVVDADQIIVLDEGEIAGIGTHQELLETNDVYREIVVSQLSEEEIA